MEDITVATVVVNDDVAVEDSLYTAGRRGVAGTIFVEKIAGAAAERGDSLEEVTRIATKVNDQTRSMGLALGPCTVPHAGKPSFDLGEDEIELGIGIHGEPGYRRGSMETADSLVAELYERVREDLGLTEGERVVGPRQRHGRHSRLRALHLLPRPGRPAEEGRHRDRPPDGRQLRHQPGDARRLRDPHARR